MAHPDLDDGWLKIAHELLAAMFVADFRKRELIVLREVFEQIYGPAKRRSALVFAPELAERCGQSRSHIWDALLELVSARVLQLVGPGQYRFVKDYEQWRRVRRVSGRGLRAAGRRFTAVEVGYIRASVARVPLWLFSAEKLTKASPNGDAHAESASPFGVRGGRAAHPKRGRSRARVVDEAPARNLRSREQKKPPRTPPQGGYPPKVSLTKHQKQTQEFRRALREHLQHEAEQRRQCDGDD